MAIEPEQHFFDGNGRIPNSRLPLLIYRNVFPHDAMQVEETLRANGWVPEWRGKAVGFSLAHHFHSDSHELIAAVHGTNRGLFGGPEGRALELHAGDVAVIPAGVAHLGLGNTSDFLMVGAYPTGHGVHDFCLGLAEEYDARRKRIGQVEIPETDPITGGRNALPAIWFAARAASLAEETTYAAR